MIKYQIVTSFHTIHLERAVNQLMDDGWCLIGGVVVATHHDGSTNWAQAMTKREPIPYEYEKHPAKEKEELNFPL